MSIRTTRNAPAARVAFSMNLVRGAQEQPADMEFEYAAMELMRKPTKQIATAERERAQRASTAEPKRKYCCAVEEEFFTAIAAPGSMLLTLLRRGRGLIRSAANRRDAIS